MKQGKKKSTPPLQPKTTPRPTPEPRPGINIGKYLPIILLVASVLLVIACRLRLLDVPLERDEGEYAYVGQQMLQGVPPFVSIYHDKLPGVYAAYWLIMGIFGKTPEGIRLGLLFINLLTGIPLCLIAKKLFNPITAAYAASVFYIMSVCQSLFGFSANSEHFILLPLLTGILLVLRGIEQLGNEDRKKATLIFFLAGIMLGISYLMKQNAIFFIAFIGLFFIYKVLTSRPVRWVDLFVDGFAVGFGSVLPLALTCLIFQRLGLFEQFWWWTWIYPRFYLAAMPWEYGKITLHYAFEGIGSGVGIRPTFWFVGIVSVWGLVVLLLNKSVDRIFFILGLLLATIIAITAGFNFYAHYFLLATPVIALLVAVGCESLLFFMRGRSTIADVVYPGFLLLLIALGTVIAQEKDYLFDQDGTLISHNSYGGNPFPEASVIGKYIEQHSKPDDKMVVLGSEPEMYFYANRRSVTGFIYTYEIYKHHPFAHKFQEQMAREIEAGKPKYMVMVGMDASWFSGYTDKSDTFLFNWSARYASAHYAPAGMLDVMYPQPDRYCWNGPNTPPCMPATRDHNIQILVRDRD